MTSATERMIAYHMARLKDKRPAVRLEAIRELRLLEATAALNVLEEVFRTDEDEDVRSAAQEAGRTLFRIKKRQEKERTPDGE